MDSISKPAHNVNLTWLGHSPPASQAGLRVGSSLQPLASLADANTLLPLQTFAKQLIFHSALLIILVTRNCDGWHSQRPLPPSKLYDRLIIMLGCNACFTWIEFFPVLGYKWKDSTVILYQCPNLQTQFSRKQAQNANFQSLKTSVLGLSSWKNWVYKFGHRMPS